MSKNIFGGLLPGLVEPIHVELSDKAMDVFVSEVFRENVLLKLVDVFDGKLVAVGEPLNGVRVLIVLGKGGFTLMIWKALWTKVAIELSVTYRFIKIYKISK